MIRLSNFVRYISLIAIYLTICAVIATNVNLYFVDGVEAQNMHKAQDTQYIGTNVRGLHTSIQGTRYSIPFPDHFYDESFKLIKKAGMNHIRYPFYWEAYTKNPSSFIKELKTVAKTADKWGLKVIYDNHQFHTSSWLDPTNGTGFPPILFQNDTSIPHGGGGTTKDNASRIWWTKWWNRNVTETNMKSIDGRGDGWTMQANFLKKIVRAVDKYDSTLGYEILNEPQIHSQDQWEKIGHYNTFMVNVLRNVTNKTLIYSMNIPISFKDKNINLTAENLAKMAPENKTNVVFKFSMYGIPIPGSYQADKLDILVKAGQIAKVPFYIGEWNDISREDAISDSGQKIYLINTDNSDLNQTDADTMLQKFKDLHVWGWAFWNWDYVPHPASNFNLINIDGNGNIETTRYYRILKHAISGLNITS